VGFGSAHLFRLAKFLEHRVTPTVGDIPGVSHFLHTLYLIDSRTFFYKFCNV
jgi:hypothetical protein